MKAVLVFALLGLAVASAAVFREEEYQLLFSKWMNQYSKKYTHDTFFYRYTVFKANMDKVFLANKQNLTYTLAMNEFGDMTHAEFKATKLGYNRIERPLARASNGHGPHEHVHHPLASVDWRTKGAVTPVKNQQQCGSCWAFSTTGSTESAHFIKAGKLVSLSEQQLVDCSGSYGNQGCNGGLMDYAFEYIKATGGLATESAYPYTARDGQCKSNIDRVVTITGYTDVQQDNEDALMRAVNLGPVSVAIEADQASFQFYSSGVLTGACGTGLDHGVLAVGYDSSASTPYWIVKNSWGASWGMQGYVELGLGSKYNQGKGQCGIAMEPSYPTA